MIPFPFTHSSVISTHTDAYPKRRFYIFINIIITIIWPSAPDVTARDVRVTDKNAWYCSLRIRFRISFYLLLIHYFWQLTFHLYYLRSIIYRHYLLSLLYLLFIYITLLYFLLINLLFLTIYIFCDVITSPLYYNT